MRARRWTARAKPAGLACVLCLIAACAWVILLCAQENHEKEVLRKKAEEQERLLQLQQLNKLQQDLKAFHKALKDDKRATNRQPPSSRQRGIVISAGGNKLLINAYVSVKVLRDTLSCTLPIEIYHNGADVGPITKAAFSVFQGVNFIDLNTLELPANRSRPQFANGYTSKILSLYLTRFSQVHYLDADSQPLSDPESFFESDVFGEQGNTFWPDYWKEGFSESPHEEVYEWLGLQPPWQIVKGWQCAESGQLFLDKQKHWEVLEWLWFLNSHAELLYKHMLGDKDTFEMAFMLAGKHEHFFRMPISPGVPLTRMYSDIRRGGWKQRYIKREESTRYFRVGVLQYHHSGAPAFLHRTERTKFANFEDGLPPEKMRPVLVIPSFGPDVPSQAKEAAWNLISVPKSMVAENCTCCLPNPGTQVVVRKALELSALHEPHYLPMPASASWLGQNSSNSKGCLWHSRLSLQKLPLFPVSIFGPSVNRAIEAGFEAYAELELLLGERVRWRESP